MKGACSMDLKWLQQLPIPNVKSFQSVSGGDVNKAFHLNTEEGPLFLLIQPQTTETFFQEEIAGLNELAKAGISSPAVIASGAIGEDAFLLLEYIESTRGDHADLGRLVAQMHRVKSSNDLFGFYEPYQTTGITFRNEWTTSWVELFVEERLEKLKAAITVKNYWTPSIKHKYEKAHEIIRRMLPLHESTPVLLHGDLWSGNFMFRPDGSPVLFDPHALYGDREFDLGISTVFGGFDDSFYRAYQEAYPLDPGAQVRLEFYRLYFLMIHFNKFGTMYLSKVEESLDQIIKFK